MSSTDRDRTGGATAVAARFRPAELADIPELMDIRDSVRENRLVTTVIGHDDYVRALTTEGRAWVCEVDGRVVGFACGRPGHGDVWALFLRQSHEGRGLGGALMDLVERWMFDQGLDEIRLATEPGTRAERLYRRRGWRYLGVLPTGEAAFALRASDRAAAPVT